MSAPPGDDIAIIRINTGSQSNDFLVRNYFGATFIGRGAAKSAPVTFTSVSFGQRGVVIIKYGCVMTCAWFALPCGFTSCNSTVITP